MACWPALLSDLHMVFAKKCNWLVQSPGAGCNDDGNRIRCCVTISPVACESSNDLYAFSQPSLRQFFLLCGYHRYELQTELTKDNRNPS